MPKIIIRKAFAYITHGNRLLLLTHPHAPEAGIQVPAGTIEDGESSEQAVLREAFEETGLIGLELVSSLGEHVRGMSDFGRAEVHHRFFFHLRCTATPPDTWRNIEAYPAESEGGELPLFEFFWRPLDDLPELIGDHGRFVPKLRDRLARA